MDPIAIRIKNEPKDDPETHLPFSSRALVQCLEEGAHRFGWGKRPVKPASLRDGRWLIGYGVACAQFPTLMQPSSASVRVNRDGTALARMSATDIGTGTYTVLTQIAAENLGLPEDRIRVEIGDTNFPRSAGSGGSWGAASSGTALQMACVQLREQIAKMAVADARSPLSGADPASVTLADGRIVTGDRAEPLEAFLARTAPDGVRLRLFRRELRQDPPETQRFLAELRSHPVSDSRLRYQEGSRDLLRGQTPEQAQCERDARLGREHRMAGREHQAQEIVADFIVKLGVDRIGKIGNRPGSSECTGARHLTFKGVMLCHK